MARWPTTWTGGGGLPPGAPVDAVTLKAGTFGLVHQFGAGLEKVNVEAATKQSILGEDPR